MEVTVTVAKVIILGFVVIVTVATEEEIGEEKKSERKIHRVLRYRAAAKP